MRVYAVAAAVFILAWLAVSRLGWLLLPLALGAALAGAAEPLLVRLSALGVPRAAAMPALLLVGGGAAVLLAVLALGALAGELREAAAELPRLYPQAQRLAAGIVEAFAAFFHALPPWLRPDARELAGWPLLALQHVAESALSGMRGLLLSGLPRALAALALGALLGHLGATDRSEIVRLSLGALPPSWRGGAAASASAAWRLLLGFLRISLGMSFATFLWVALALLALGAPWPLLVGAVCGLLDLLPMIGPGLLLLPWAFLLAASGNPAAGLGVLCVQAGSVVLRWALQARLARASLGVHPAVAMYALYAGALVLGPVGLFAVPLALLVLQALSETGVLRWNGAGA